MKYTIKKTVNITCEMNVWEEINGKTEGPRSVTDADIANYMAARPPEVRDWIYNKVADLIKEVNK